MAFRYWSALSSYLNGIVRDVEREWLELLNDPTKLERDYQSFLNRNAGFFWADGIGCVVVGSQLSLGADLDLDFVQSFDRGSQGFAYELIEIESPHTPPFNSNGDPGARLNHALQQIRDWKQWIDSNRNGEAGKLFPSGDLIRYGRSVFRYRIIIGRRSNSEAYLNRRNQLNNDSGVEVRSFDYLTDRLRHRIYVNTLMAATAPECKQLSEEIRNEMVNPFNEAIPDSRWRRMVKDPRFYTVHMNCLNHKLLTEAWRQSSLLARFDAEWLALPTEHKHIIEQNWLAGKY